MSNSVAKIKRKKGYKKISNFLDTSKRMTATQAVNIVLKLAEDNMIKLKHDEMTEEQIKEQALQVNAILIMKRVQQYIIKGESGNV